MDEFPQHLTSTLNVLLVANDYTATQIARAALAQVSEYERLPLLRALLAELPQRAKPFVLVDFETRQELGHVDEVPYPQARIIDGKTGRPMLYNHVSTVPEYDFREDDQNGTKRMLVLMRKSGDDQ